MADRPRILIVDDDEDFVESTKTILESKPYDVIVAREGNEGIQKARDEKPDLIILDVIMPVKDGFTAAEQIKDDPELRHIPVLMLTGFSSKRQDSAISVRGGYTLEAEDYIEKPIAPDELLAKVQRYLTK